MFNIFGGDPNKRFEDNLKAKGATPDGGITRKVGDWYGDLTGRNQAFDKESEFARSMALEAWERETAYNSPLAQMQRYKEAGLNPHLIYGQGTPGNTNAAVPSTPKVQPNNLLEMVPAIMSVVGFAKDMKLKDAQINATNVSASQREASTLMIQEKLDQLQKSFPFLFEGLQTDVGIKGQTLQKLQNLNKLFPVQQERANVEVQKLYTEISKNIQSFNTGTLQQDLLKQQALEKELNNKLLKAMSMFTDQGITNPQQLGQFLMMLLFKSIKTN